MSQKCPVCTKAVYFNEEAKAIGKTFHKLCLKCSQCNKLLDSTSINDHDDALFCGSCHRKLFGTKGYGYAAGGAGLSSNGTGNQTKIGGGLAEPVSICPKYGATDLCPRCNKTVYFAEERRALGKKYHKLCLVCRDCKKMLDSTTLTSHEDDIYCKSCYGKNFGPRGYGFAGGSSGLSMDTGNPGEVTTENVSSLAKAQAVSLTTNGHGPKLGGADACPRCHKPVYFAEEKRALGKKYHKLCLCCTECQKQLDSTTLTNHGDNIYCKACYGRKFGPRGYGFAAGGAGLSMEAGKPGDNVSALAKAQAVSHVTNGDGPKLGGVDACPRCHKPVYFAEEKRALGKKYHKLCLCCTECQKQLDSTTLTNHGDNIYCKSCYGKQFGPRGYGFAAGGAGLSMEAGKPGDNVSSYSKAQVIGDSKGDAGGMKFGGADSCRRCGKAVYFAEKVAAGGYSFHKLCFRCFDCNKALESTTLCEAGDKVVCKSCYSKNYGPKGFGFGALNTTA